jgi:signal transduction histidine kinase/DNA-binding response OmpR family regulator
VPLTEAVVDAGEGERSAILIVDDLPEKLLVFRTILDDLGQDIVCARSGREALKEVLHGDFAVILLDVNMPDIDGFETATLVRGYKRSAHTPIIFITSYADEMQTTRGYSLGAVDYILSPVVPEVLRSKVKVFVDLHLMQRRLKRHAEERVALAAAEAARRAAEESTRRADFLAQASRVLADALDEELAAQRLVQLLVPLFATRACLVCLDGAGEPQRWVAAQSRRAADGPAGEADAMFAAGDARVTRGGAEALPAADRAHLAAAFGRQATSGSDATGERRTERPAGADAGVSARAGDWPASAPATLVLSAGGQALGGLLVEAGEGADWVGIRDLAGRAATALENARLYRSLQLEIEERRGIEARLHASNRRKDEFLAMLSHELRNPLAPIRTALEVIRRLAPSEPKLTWAIDVTGRQVTHLTRLVEDLLDVARINQGKITLQMEAVDLREVLVHGIETVRPFLESRRHQLARQVPDTPVWMRGDFARLSQVVANLLNNAAKYTEEGGAIELSLGVGADGQATISVCDNGIGIDAELLPHVFELFEQGKRSLDRSQGGLGVGLTLVRSLVELHQGRVEATSEGAGRGAQFRIHLPCLSEAVRAEPAHADEEPWSAGTRCRVLVVDDNHDAAEAAAVLLSLAGHEVKAVGDPLEALGCAPVFAPDVVVLDIGLPGIDGYDLARRLRQVPQTRASLMVALTGYGQRGDLERARAAGFDHHLTKPAEPEELLALIQMWRSAQLGAPIAAGARASARDAALR